MKNLLHISLIFLSAAAMLAAIDWAVVINDRMGSDVLACIPAAIAGVLLGSLTYLATHPRKRRNRA